MTEAGSSAAAPRIRLPLTVAIPRPVTAPMSNRVELFVIIASIHGRPLGSIQPCECEVGHTLCAEWECGMRLHIRLILRVTPLPTLTDQDKPRELARNHQDDAGTTAKTRVITSAGLSGVPLGPPASGR